MAYSKVGWENLPQQTTPLSAENFNHMDKGIADLDGRVTTLEQGGIGTSSFESLKLKSQTLSTAAEDTTYIFYNDEKKLNWLEDGNPAQYDMSARPLQLLISMGATTDDQFFHRIIVKSVVENDTEIRITVASHWALNLEQLIGKTPDELNYIILRNNVGTPFGNYKISNNKQVANLSLDGKTYHNGAVALGQGTLSIAPFTLTSGQANTAAIRRSTALGGEYNSIFKWAGTAFGVWNNVYGGVAFAGGSYANIIGYGAVNFGGGKTSYNVKNRDGSFKSLEQIIAEKDLDENLVPNINYGTWNFNAGYGNIAGANFSAVFGYKNTTTANATSSLVVGERNINNVKSAIVTGYGITNTDSLLNINNVFKVLPDGVNIAKSYQGEGSKINIAKVVEANPSVEPENLTFKTLTIDDYTNGNLTTNTEQSPGNVNYGLKAVIDYSSKTTFWHNKYDVIDGTPVPNPQLTDDNPYTISLKVDAEMIKTFTGQLIIRFYPREQQDATTGVWSIIPGIFPVDVRIRIGGQSATFNNLTTKDYSNIDTEANNSFYRDFIVPFDGVLTEGSEINFDILKVSSVSAEYPNGKFACAQGIRFGYSNYSTVTKPDIDVSTVGNIASKINKINDGAYYSTKQLLMMIKANTPSIPENIVTTDKANVVNGYAALDANKNINVAGMKIPCIDSFDYDDETTYSSKGVNCTDKDGFTISTFHGKKINFGSKMPSKITTDFNQFIFEGYYSDEKGYSHKGSIILYNNFNGTSVEDLALWSTNENVKNKSVIKAVMDNADSAAAIVDKQDKPTINSIISSSTITLTANTEYHHIKEDSSTLTFTLPTTIEEDYQSYISFKSGATATTITISTFDGTLKFKGDDCTNGIFTPAANTVYEVALKCIGMDSNNKPYIVARVGAC